MGNTHREDMEAYTVYCPYLNWLRYRLACGMILFILSIVFGVTYVVLDNWSCRTGFILHASILCCVTFLIMLSAATTAQFSFVLATIIIVLLTSAMLVVVYEIYAR